MLRKLLKNSLFRDTLVIGLLMYLYLFYRVPREDWLTDSVLYFLILAAVLYSDFHYLRKRGDLGGG